MWAVWEGLNLTHIQYLIIELDALDTVNLLHGTDSQNELLTPIIVDCQRVLQDFREVQVQHNYHEGNLVVDILVKMGREFVLDVMFFETPPRDELCCMMREVATSQEQFEPYQPIWLETDMK